MLIYFRIATCTLKIAQWIIMQHNHIDNLFRIDQICITMEVYLFIYYYIEHSKLRRGHLPITNMGRSKESITVTQREQRSTLYDKFPLLLNQLTGYQDTG